MIKRGRGRSEMMRLLNGLFYFFFTFILSFYIVFGLWFSSFSFSISLLYFVSLSSCWPVGVTGEAIVCVYVLQLYVFLSFRFVL